MPRFGKNHFHPFLLSVLKMNDTINFEDNFFPHYWLSNQNLPFKVCNTDCVMPYFDKIVYSQQFVLGGLRVNHSVNIENYFS